MESCKIFGSVCFSSQSLTSVCKTVHKVREEEVELHEHSIDREDDSPLAGTCGSEIEINGHQTERAEENVAIYFEEFRNLVGAGVRGYGGTRIHLPQTYLDPPYPRTPVPPKQSSIIPHNQPQSHDETGILCNNRTPSHTLDLHPKAIDQRQ